MKKITFAIIAFMLAILPLIHASKPKEVNTTALFSLIRDFKTEKGVEVVSLGRIALRFATGIVSAQADSEEERLSLEMLKGVTKLVVVDYEDASDNVKQRFNSSVMKILEKSEKLMEIKDDGESVDIYGVPSADGTVLKDCVIMSQEDCSMICVMGRIPLDKINALVAMENDR